jgi:hypothetical protein
MAHTVQQMWVLKLFLLNDKHSLKWCNTAASEAAFTQFKLTQERQKIGNLTAVLITIVSCEDGREQQSPEMSTGRPSCLWWPPPPFSTRFYLPQDLKVTLAPQRDHDFLWGTDFCFLAWCLIVTPPFYCAYHNHCGFAFEREVMGKIVNHPFIIS